MVRGMAQHPLLPRFNSRCRWTRAIHTVAAGAALCLTACLGSYGYPKGEDSPLFATPIHFASGAVRYGVSGAAPLDPGDATVMAAGWQGFGLTQKALTQTLSAGEALSYLEDKDMELVYITGHGLPEGPAFNDVVLTPAGLGTRSADGEVDIPSETRPLRISARYVILANCQSGNANWSIAFTDNTEAVFGYTVDTVDFEDNEVASYYLECLDDGWHEGTLWSTDEHLACWRQANERAGGLFAQGWVAFARRNGNDIWHVDPQGSEMVRPGESSGGEHY
jgi:hypothetical protein